MDGSIEMIKWKIADRVISEIVISDLNLINKWGVETADSWSFFSLEKDIGYRYQVKEYSEVVTENKFNSFSHIKMKEGEWILEVIDELKDNKITRKAKVVCLEDSYFMDFVIRFRFKAQFFTKAFIAGHELVHSKSNIYHQYPVNEAQLDGLNYSAKFKLINSQCLGKFKPHLYVRDHLDEWVVHARMIPTVEDKNIIKLCSRYFRTSPLPQVISNFILSFPLIKKYLWFRAEHTPYKTRFARFFSPNAFPLVQLKKGQEIFWEVEVELNEK
ncbi:MAG: hypothetical protein Q7U04_10780 [Bacteriovorax sp.]|nr:hypothetical protein [Bacteriovorax sp.]